VFRTTAVMTHNFRVFPTRSEELWLQYPKVDHDIPLPCIYNSSLTIICTLYNQCGCETYLNKPRINQQTKHPLCKILLFPETHLQPIELSCSVPQFRGAVTFLPNEKPGHCPDIHQMPFYTRIVN
jgi:hypothetical protein